MFEEFHSVADSLTRWKQEICNSYLLFGGKRITNARTEGFNNLVKVIKNVVMVIQSSKDLGTEYYTFKNQTIS